MMKKNNAHGRGSHMMTAASHYRDDDEDDEEDELSEEEEEEDPRRNFDAELQSLLSFRRPKRQRTSTTFYTDENPSTHTYPTAKVKREEEAAAALASVVTTPPPTKGSSSSSSNRGRPSSASSSNTNSNRNNNKQRNKSPSVVVSNSNNSVVSEYARPYNRSPTSSRRRHSTSPHHAHHAHRSTYSSSNNNNNTAETPVKRPRGRPKRKRPLPSDTADNDWGSSSAPPTSSSRSTALPTPTDKPRVHTKRPYNRRKSYSQSPESHKKENGHVHSAQDLAVHRTHADATSISNLNHNGNGNSNTSTDNNELVKKPRRRGRPPKKHKLKAATLDTATTISSSSSSRTLALKSASTRSVSPSLPGNPSTQQHSRISKRTTTPPPGIHSNNIIKEDAPGTCLSHSVRISPVLPCSVTAADKTSLQQTYPIVFRRGTAPQQPLPKNQWDSVYEPPIYFDRDYDQSEDEHSDNDDPSSNDGLPDTQANDSANDNTNNNPLSQPSFPSSPNRTRQRQSRKYLDLEDLPPVHRTVSCLTMRTPTNDYLAVGDTAGFVTIYSMDPVIRPIQRLESVACAADRSYAQQSTLRHAKKKVRRTRGDTATIHAMSFVRSRIVLATSCELECMDIPTGSSLWVFPFDPARRQVMSLDMHPLTYDVLVSCRMTKPPKTAATATAGTDATASAADTSTTAVPGPISPMLVLKHAHGNVEICDANSPSLVKSPFCTAIWDASVISSSNKNQNLTQLLLCSPMADDTNDWKLILLQGGSIDQWKVKTKTKVPSAHNINSAGSAANNNAAGTAGSSAAGGTILTLRQSPKGKYTFVASARGIRLFQTKTLSLLHVYGDQLALHGRSIVWQDVVIMGKVPSKRHYVNQTDNLAECDDVLSMIKDKTEGISNKKNEDDNGEEDLGQYIVGIPHPTKGPKELCEALHVWKTGHATSVPLVQIALPDKSDGVQSLVASTSTSTITNKTGLGDRLILATQQGTCHQWVPSIESSFAGIMYPPGYQVLNDNVEYIEDEDELDESSPTTTIKAPASAIIEENGVEDDPELQEAMRLSMLEQYKSQQQTKDQEEDIVVVVDMDDSDTDDYDDNENDPVHLGKPSYFPCRPEPYLRQLINSNMDGDDDGAPITKESKKKKEAASQETTKKDDFISTILDVLPHSETALEQKRSLTTETFTFTTFTTMVAVDAKTNANNAAKANRGRRSRASNLEAMMKSAIDPRLQAYMNPSRHEWCNGSGSKFVFKKSVATKEEKKPAVVETSEMVVAATVEIDSEQIRVVSDSSETNLNENETGQNVMVIKSAEVVSASTAVISEKPPQEAKALTVEVAPPAENGQSTKSEEAAIFALLGLSPCNAVSPASNVAGVLGGAPAKVAPAILSNPFGREVRPMAESPLMHGRFKNATTSARPAQRPPKNTNCPACMGRMVIHACGKRSLPIDYDEVIRKERLKREKEEDERKRMQKEKRRQADARRREARRQKQREIDERKRRQEQSERIEKERRRRLDMASYEASSNHIDDRNSYITSYRKQQKQHNYAVANSSSYQHNRSYSDQPSSEIRSYAAAPSSTYESNAAPVERTYAQAPVAQSFVQTLPLAAASASAAAERAYSFEHRQYRAYGQTAHVVPRQNSAPSAAPTSWSKASITGATDTFGRRDDSEVNSLPSYSTSERTAASKPHRSVAASSNTLSPVDALAALASIAGETASIGLQPAARKAIVNRSSVSVSSFDAATSAARIPTYASLHTTENGHGVAKESSSPYHMNGIAQKSAAADIVRPYYAQQNGDDRQHS